MSFFGFYISYRNNMQKNSFTQKEFAHQTHFMTVLLLYNTQRKMYISPQIFKTIIYEIVNFK